MNVLDKNIHNLHRSIEMPEIELVEDEYYDEKSKNYNEAFIAHKLREQLHKEFLLLNEEKKKQKFVKKEKERLENKYENYLRLRKKYEKYQKI